jgi:hypothetical protein
MLGKLLAKLARYIRQRRKAKGKGGKMKGKLVQSLTEKVARWIMAAAGAAGVMVSDDAALTIASGLIALASLVWSVIDAKRKAKPARTRKAPEPKAAE